MPVAGRRRKSSPSSEERRSPSELTAPRFAALKRLVVFSGGEFALQGRGSAPLAALSVTHRLDVAANHGKDEGRIVFGALELAA